MGGLVEVVSGFFFFDNPECLDKLMRITINSWIYWTSCKSNKHVKHQENNRHIYKNSNSKHINMTKTCQNRWAASHGVCGKWILKFTIKVLSSRNVCVLDFKSNVRALLATCYFSGFFWNSWNFITEAHEKYALRCSKTTWTFKYTVPR